MVVVTTALQREHGARSRARDAVRERPRRGAHRRWSRDRIWHPAAHVSLAERRQPDRVEISAAVQRYRLQCGRKTAGDDELFAHLVALVHVLYAKAHTEQAQTDAGEKKKGSAHFATTYEQIMSALAEKFGIWGPAPTKDTPEREEWVSDHRPRLYDWLEILRQSGLISHDSRGVKDNARVWWRTEVTVLGVPADLTREELAAARSYAAAFPDRERDRRRRGRVRPYAEIFKAAKRPSKTQKKAKAIVTARATRKARRGPHSGSSGGPCSPALPPTGATAEFEPTPFDEEAFTTPNTSLDRTGVRERPRPGTPDRSRRLRRSVPADHSRVRPTPRGGNLEPPAGYPGEGEGELSEHVRRAQRGPHGRRRSRGPVSPVERATWVEEGLSMAQTLRALGADVDLTDGPSLEAITRAWYLERYGEDEMMRLLPWCPRFDVAELVDAAALYRRHAAAKLPGWPTDPLGALLRMASTPLPPYEVRVRQDDGRWKAFTRYSERPETIAYAVRGLRMLARDMAAAAVLLEDRRPAVQEPEIYQQPTGGRVSFRHEVREAWDEDEATRRQRVRDQLVKAGGNPRRHHDCESMELELVDRERHDLLPAQFAYPSPTKMRAHRGAWMPAWYVTTPDALSPVSAWAQILAAAGEWIDEHTIELWLTGLAPIELADGTLTVAGPATHVQFVTTRLATVLDQIREASGVARRLRIVDLADFSGGRHHTPPRPPAADPGADGKAARAGRHLKRMEIERRRLLTERDQTISDTELVARRSSATADNETWDELMDIAATRAEFHGPTVVDLWLRPLLPRFGDDGILTLTGHASTIEPVRMRLGDQVTHLVRAIVGGRGVAWHAIDDSEACR
ncbi:MAG: hypothetical protein Q7T55_06555 [Solirubrobacteraceae bacterium]|nr:hypothetical protein [Solirubrobacteraceae bacterium]